MQLWPNFKVYFLLVQGVNVAPEPQSLEAQPEFGWSATRAGERLQITLLDKLPEIRPGALTIARLSALA